MHFATILTALSLGTGAHAWAQAANGEWIANDVKYTINGYGVWEACTYRNTNNLVPVGGGCRYWTNANGGIYSGYCRDVSVFGIGGRTCLAG
ncbi:hypothetical protein HJFPF1_09823 [Paramyrothecium foliicola]|nr:hypothetical protein HJFPF1_09823 [Paramyrothecium foliicola]